MLTSDVPVACPASRVVVTDRADPDEHAVKVNPSVSATLAIPTRRNMCPLYSTASVPAAHERHPCWVRSAQPSLARPLRLLEADDSEGPT